MIIWKVAVYR